MHFQCVVSVICVFYRELKDSLGSDDLEGDVPVLLQLMLSRNPNIFRNKSTPSTPQYPAQTGKAHPTCLP